MIETYIGYERFTDLRLQYFNCIEGSLETKLVTVVRTRHFDATVGNQSPKRLERK